MHRKPSRRSPLIAALTIALVIATGALFVRPGPTVLGAAPVDLSVPAGMTGEDLHQWCVDRLAQGTRGLSSAAKTWLMSCRDASAPIPSPSGSPTPTPPGPTATPTPGPTTPSPTPTVTTPAPTTPVPTTTPTPSPTGTPGFPTAGDTAAGSTGWRHTGVTLTLRTGLIRVQTAGTVIDSVEARDGIQVYANNVTIRRSLVEGAGSGPGAGIWINAGVTGTVIEDVEVTSRPGADPNNEAALVDRAITGKNTTGTVYRRVYAHRIIRGLEPGCDTLIEDSYVDDEVNPGGAHMSAIGASTCPEFTMVVRHNHIGLTPNDQASAALLVYPPQVPIDQYGTQHVTISWTDNEIRGGTYCLWLSSDPKFTGTMVVTGNWFRTDYYASCGRYGAVFTDLNFATPPEGNVTRTWADNRWTDGRLVTQ